MRVLLVCVGMASLASATLQMLAPPTFTADQAARGETIYMDKCVACHGDDLANGEFGTPLKGQAFREQWAGKGLGEAFSYMRENMPPDSPGGLSAEAYADVLAFILSKNGIAPSGDQLPSDVEKLKDMAPQP